MAKQLKNAKVKRGKGFGGKYDDDVLGRMLVKEMDINGFNLTAACRKIGISPTTFYNLKARCEWFRMAIEDVEECRLDTVEGRMMEKIIEEGNVPLIIFYLNNKGRRRGWGVKNEESSDISNQPITINIITEDDKSNPGSV